MYDGNGTDNCFSDWRAWTSAFPADRLDVRRPATAGRTPSARPCSDRILGFIGENTVKMPGTKHPHPAKAGYTHHSRCSRWRRELVRVVGQQRYCQRGAGAGRPRKQKTCRSTMGDNYFTPRTGEA